jgi:hypothetical protein
MVEIGLWLNPATVLAICVWNPPGRSTFQLCCRLMLAVPPFYFVALMVCAAVNNQRCVVNHEIKCIDSVSLFKGWCDGRHPLGVRNRRVLAVPMIAGKSIVLSRKDEITFHWVCRRGARENIQPFSCIVHHLSMTWGGCRSHCLSDRLHSIARLASWAPTMHRRPDWEMDWRRSAHRPSF